MASKFMILGQKKSKVVVDPLEVPYPLIVQDPPPVLDPILAFLGTIEVEASLSKNLLHDKHKGKPEFSIVELGKQVIMDDSTKDHDTSLALARAVMLPNDVADLVAKGLEEIRDLLVMQQVQPRWVAGKLLPVAIWQPSGCLLLVGSTGGYLEWLLVV
ncbi:hypothetical protein Acr_10g0007250 [Actinidia rufa]|uniref:Uncharacterized protein n=1 Tax=Actinidia rufa TaxID=165716 RepID=A0A7J0F9G2_9ERIC|nr:hypothetical protein Acr_10g0007250 [Actinidia rufa]